MIDSKTSLWYNSPGATHFNINRAGKQLDWHSMDNKERFEQNCQDPEKKIKLQSLGFLEPNCVTYKFNHQGFRCDEFDDRPAGMALGCSFTEGVGISVNDTWPAVLSGLVGQHIWNLGLGGGSMDTCFRMLDHYIDILNPKFIVLCHPPAQRFEFFDKYNKSRVLIAGHLDTEVHKEFGQEWMANDTNIKTNQRRNLLAMKWRCQEKNIPFFAFSVTNTPNNQDDLWKDACARDLSHPGGDTNHHFAHKIYKKIKDVVSPMKDLS